LLGTLALRSDPSDAGMAAAYDQLLATRPTAVNLRWALDDVRTRMTALRPEKRSAAAYRRAAEICDEDVATCRSIGEHGFTAIHGLWEKKDALIG
jgi:methylthioribose-1-phosphate isomerase